MTWTWRNGSHLEGKLPVCACSVTSFDRTHCRPEKDFLGNGWKLELVVSYKPADLDFKPSVKVKSLQVDCTLAPIPRYVPTTTRKFRVEKETYRTSHNGATTVLDKEGTVEAMNPTRGINIYIPIPIRIFSVAETRAFDIEVRAWVSVGSSFPVILRTVEQIMFSSFVKIERDGSMRCTLLD